MPIEIALFLKGVSTMYDLSKRALPHSTYYSHNVYLSLNVIKYAVIALK
jgi:hypothetical protein